MRTKAEEIAAFEEILWRQHQQKIGVYRDIDASFSDSPRGRAALAKYGHYPIDDGTATFALCILHRGVLARPDNVKGGCADCYSPIEFRPTLSARLTCLCAFCALRRMDD